MMPRLGSRPCIRLSGCVMFWTKWGGGLGDVLASSLYNHHESNCTVGEAVFR
jgi:hypothetical protein